MPSAIPQSDAKTSILLVEDEDMLRGLIQELLQSQGYDVEGAAGGEEALALAGRAGYRVDLLLTDVMMPHMTGNELVEKLRPKHPQIKVIYMSGYTGGSSPFIQQSLNVPGVAFLPKPFRLQSLLLQVEALMGQKAGG